MHTPPALPMTRDLVLVGGGHTHALVLRAWGMRPLPGARLTVISPAPTAPYTGMLPGHIAGHYSHDALQIDLVRLTRHAGARLVLGRAEGIDRAAGVIHVPGRAPIGYDLASVDIGITSSMPELAGFAEHAASAKPMDRYARDWALFLAAAKAGQVPPEVVVIGAGVAGVELALAMAHRLHEDRVTGARVTVLETRPDLLPNIGRGARAALIGHMQRLGVVARTTAQVSRIERDAVHLADGTRLVAGFTLGAGGPRPQAWLADTGLHLTDGYITVDPWLRSVTDPSILAVGDCAHMAASPRAKAGVYAVRQAPVLTANLRASLGAGRLRRYRAQRDYLKLVSTGHRNAVADKWGLRLDGRWLWWLKDRIDARFMGRLADLAPMPPPALPAQVADGVRSAVAGGQPICAGCGAKVGPQALRAALAGLPAAAHPDLLTGPGDDAAVLRAGDGRVQVITTDHLRALTEDAGLMARIAAVHAMGDIWAMGARPQVALANLTLPPMTPALQRRTLTEIMAAAAEVLAAEGAAIAGGHTAQGAEASIGFSVTGIAEPGRVLGKGGARPGDALLLTKPLGTGVVLAAEMARAAPGPAVAAAWASMAQPQGAAAALLEPTAHAMTDVTGFGLAGHVMEMMAASGTAAGLDIAALPLLPAAAQLSAEGYASTLAPENAAAVLPFLTGAAEAEPLLFDPQTSGGLLAAVPAAAAARLLDDLHAAGFARAAVIGTVTEGPPGLSLAGRRAT